MIAIRPFVILLASIVIQLCLGGLYAWSTFVAPLQRDYGLSSAQAQSIFGATIATFTLVMVVAGRLLARFGPRLITTVGGVLFAAGYLLAASSEGRFFPVLLGVGVVTGAGIGCAYVCPLATAARWFPRHRGLVTGLTVAGMGAGAILLGQLAARAFAHGVPVLAFFAYLGVGYGLLMVLAAQALALPADDESADRDAFPFVPALRHDRQFIAMLIGMFCGTFAGLLVIGNLASIGRNLGIPASVALLAVSFFAVGNAAGRIGWGILGDRFGPQRMIIAALLLGAGSLFALPYTAGVSAFLFCTVLIAIAFGGCFVLFAAQVSAVYGACRLQVVYPWIFLAYGVAALTGPTIGGWLHDATGSYHTAALIAAAVSATGLVVFAWLQQYTRPASASNTTMTAGRSQTSHGAVEPARLRRSRRGQKERVS